jgi:hypothetical protein
MNLELKQLLFFILFFVPITIFSHGGRTDSKGGHKDNKNNSYHYHHGCSAHQHFNGCIYNYNECNENNYLTKKNHKKKSINLIKAIGAIIALLLSILISYWLFSFAFSYLKKNKKKVISNISIGFKFFLYIFMISWFYLIIFIYSLQGIFLINEKITPNTSIEIIEIINNFSLIIITILFYAYSLLFRTKFQKILNKLLILIKAPNLFIKEKIEGKKFQSFYLLIYYVLIILIFIFLLPIMISPVTYFINYFLFPV